jgi:hypothetical protein
VAPTIETRLLILVSAVLETGTGLALLLVPRFVLRLLLGTALVGPGVATSRLCGIALISLGLASWPNWQPTQPTGPTRHRPDRRAVRALLVYNASATAYLAGLMALDGFRGILLLPAIAIHAVLAGLLARVVVSAKTLRQSAETESG